MYALGAADFAHHWLDEADYGNEPDHDGHNTKGWTVFNQHWGHVYEIRSAIVGSNPSGPCMEVNI